MSKPTRVDRAWTKIFNHPRLAWPIVGGTIVIAIVSGASKIYDLWKSVATQSRSGESVFLECRDDAMPSEMPAEGRVYFLETTSDPRHPLNSGSSIEFNQVVGEPGMKLRWNDGEDLPTQRQAVRCDITNYSTSALFGVTLQLHLTFVESIAVVVEPPMDLLIQQRREAGNVFLESDWPVRFPKLDASRPLAFFIRNCCDEWVRIQLPRLVVAAAGARRIPLASEPTFPLTLAPTIRER